MVKRETIGDLSLQGKGQIYLDHLTVLCGEQPIKLGEAPVDTVWDPVIERLIDAAEKGVINTANLDFDKRAESLGYTLSFLVIALDAERRKDYSVEWSENHRVVG